MESIELNNWIVRENAFEVALWKFYAKLIPGNYSIDVEINDSDMIVKKYKFKNFEEAFDFVQKHVHKAFTFDEIDEAYNNLNKDKPKVKTKKIN